MRGEKAEKCGCNDYKGRSKILKRRNHHNSADKIKNKSINPDNSGNESNEKSSRRDRLPVTSLERKVQIITSATKVLLDDDHEGETNEGNCSDDAEGRTRESKSSTKQQLLEDRLEKRKSLERMINGPSKRPNCTVRDSCGNKVVVVKGETGKVKGGGGKGGKHERTYTYPITRDRTDEMDAIHQNMVKMKKVAGQAMKVR